MTLVNLKTEDFDESTYRKLNPAIVEFIENGAFLSGWHHYIAHGFDENRRGVPDGLRERLERIFLNKAVSAVPPERLRNRVHGPGALANFERVGKIVSFDLYNAIRSTPIAFNAENCILDFGCGCGRIMRYFHKFFENRRFYGTDIDAEAISWCQRSLSDVAEFKTNQEVPPLPFSDDFFDFVYSISVFTHLPEDMQLEWLRELNRVTKKDGYLILSIHGKDLLPNISNEQRERFEKHGFYYYVGKETEGLPSFYQRAYHTEEYIRTQWSRFFEIQRIISRGIANRQDLVLVKNSKNT